jgi:hypothetical protein
MMSPESWQTPAQSRRGFLKRTAIAAAGAASAGPLTVFGGEAARILRIVPAADDVAVAQPAVQWAIEHLRSALAERGLESRLERSLEAALRGNFCVLVGTAASASVRSILEQARLTLPQTPEALGLERGKLNGRQVLLASGADFRGLMYAILELADRVTFAPNPVRELDGTAGVVQRPANKVRSVARLFASDIEDKPWFNSRDFWERYFSELAMQRFNRFHLALGLGYDFTTDIHDAYFHFAYPFLVEVPGFNVRAVPLPEKEREANLAMLQFISDAAVRRGLHFQLGLWTHAWQWVDSPHANYVIEGLSNETHAAYCREALATLLRACPAIGGVTFRIHGESGVAEGSYDFWATIFEGVSKCGRRVEIDMHAKGIDDRMIELGLATGMPVKVSPKFWAEHMGLGYMQGAIRPLEMPPREESDRGFFAKSSGSRRFMRYGYGDLLKEGRRYEVLHRLWPGTQRLLLWASPEMAADYGRAAGFCDSVGGEWCEPLSFKGRKGSGLPGGRDSYEDPSLRPAKGDFTKYLYSYRVWGRHLYDPACDADQWRRCLRYEFGAGAGSLETALQEASRILPLVTTAHCPSAANNNYWPEMYTNMPIVDAKRPHPYGDTLSPKRFGTVSTLDPEFFSRVDDFAEQLLTDKPGAKYSPAWVAAMLESSALAAEKAMDLARHECERQEAPEFRRVAADVALQCGLGRFFSRKFRAGILFALYQTSGARAALEEALAAYRRARAAWVSMAQGATSVYRKDTTFGPVDYQRGHWADRVPAMDADIADMEKLINEVGSGAVQSKTDPKVLNRAVQTVLQYSLKSGHATPAMKHRSPDKFRRGETVQIEAVAGRGATLSTVRLRFRRVNQAESWHSCEMEHQADHYRAVIPGSYSDSPYPLQYHFECCANSGEAWFYPGLRGGSQGQPYYVIRQI